MSKQRTRTDFLCLTISAGAGREETSPAGINYTYLVSLQSDATGGRARFTYHDSIHRHGQQVDQLDREALLYAFWSFCMDAEAGSQSFHDFCSDFGENEDSMTAHRIWKACREARRKFDRMFHDDREPSWALEMLEVEGIA